MVAIECIDGEVVPSNGPTWLELLDGKRGQGALAAALIPHYALILIMHCLSGQRCGIACAIRGPRVDPVQVQVHVSYTLLILAYTLHVLHCLFPCCILTVHAAAREGASRGAASTQARGLGHHHIQQQAVL